MAASVAAGVVLEKELRAAGKGSRAVWLGEPMGVLLIQITMPSDLFPE